MKRLAPLIALGITVALIAFVALTIAAMTPPNPGFHPPSVVSTPLDVFSAERALVHVRAIARAPHPPGTPEHTRVRDYVKAQFEKLGLQTHIQKTLAIRDERRMTIAVPVENVIAGRPGSAGATLILAAHYDSHPTGPGAGDDAAGVAALLETARALVVGPNKDPLFVITDAEELGLNGAEGFVADAPEAKDRRSPIVLNFEARGGGGPVFMFETGAGNAGLIAELGSVPGHVNASSLMYALYKLLPNDTDLSVFKREGFGGLNFAFVDRWQHYHTALDTPERLDMRSLQQHGEYALGLARRLGDADLSELSDPKQGDAIYFDLFSRILLHYPLLLAWPLTAAALALYGFAIYRARRDDGFVAAFGIGIRLLAPFSLLAAGAVGFAIGLIAEPTRIGLPNRSPYGVRWGEAGVYLMAVAAAATVWLLPLRRQPLRPLVLGALTWWALALVAVTAFLPGGTYLFLWPFVAGVAALLPKESKLWHGLLGAIPALALWPVILHGLFLLMGYSLTPAFAALAAFALAPLLPAICATRGWLAGFCAIGGIACLAIGLPPRPASPATPHVNTLFYFEDADLHEARWASLDTRLSDWNRPFLGAGADEPGAKYFPWLDRKLRTAPTKPLGLALPHATRIGDTLHVSPAPGQRQIVVWTAAAVRSATVDGKPVPLSEGGRLRLRFVAPPAIGFHLKLDAPRGTEITIDGYTDGLPASVPPRPDGWMPAPVAPHTDIQLVRRKMLW